MLWFRRSVMSDFLWPTGCSMPGLPVLHHLPEFTQTHVHQVGDAIQPSHRLSSLLLLPSIPPTIWVFSNESALCIMWPKDWSFSFSICPSNEYSLLISFRMDLLDLLAGQRTLKSLLQNSSSTASILWPQSSLLSNSRIRTWLLEKPQLWLNRPLLAKWRLSFLIRCLGLS